MLGSRVSRFLVSIPIGKLAAERFARQLIEAHRRLQCRNIGLCSREGSLKLMQSVAVLCRYLSNIIEADSQELSASAMAKREIGCRCGVSGHPDTTKPAPPKRPFMCHRQFLVLCE